jgi:GH25 family lysozyme M1 (1,4-beta-N-acetylmuramidase)
MLYTGESFYNTYFDKTAVTDDLWIAKYSKTAPSVGREVAIWQYSSDAVSENYYSGKLDQNYLYVNTFQGSKTVEANVTINPYPIPTRTLKKTIPLMSGNDVKWLQWELAEVGLLQTSDIDGKFGNGTLAAVKSYQTAHGLKVDGVVGSATRYAMQND